MKQLSIVVGVDFTDCSRVALNQAIRLAAASDASLHVVHVLDTLVVIELEELLSPMQRDIRDGLVRDANNAWRDFAKEVPGADKLPIEISINNRIVGILKRCHEHRADLLVLGASGERQPNVGVGTVATACVRKSNTDVLLVRDTQAQPFKTVVAAVDFSPTSLRAVEQAVALAAYDGADLHLLHVFQAPWHRLHYRSPTVEVAPSFQKQYHDCLERRLVEFCHPALQSHCGPLRHSFSVIDYRGHRSGIVEYAQSVSADLIALGTRGRTNIRDILLGSTAEKALNETQCSILAVKPHGFQHSITADDQLARVAKASCLPRPFEKEPARVRSKKQHSRRMHGDDLNERGHLLLEAL